MKMKKAVKAQTKPQAQRNKIASINTKALFEIQNNIKAENKEIKYIGRKPAASPATGHAKKHLAQQKEIIEKVLS